MKSSTNANSRFVLLLGALPFGDFVGAEESDAPNDAENSKRLQFTEDDLPKDEKDPAGESEIDEFARRRGFNYARVTRRAARGDAKALKQFFELSEDVDGAAAESYRPLPTVVYHLLGDDKFAKFLNTQPRAFRLMVRNSIAGDGAAYQRRHFRRLRRLCFAGKWSIGLRLTNSMRSAKFSRTSSISTDRKSSAPS